MYNFLKMTYFNQKITAWYNQNHRQLPWRKTTDPYKIWISEIILQQTQVKQGLNYYIRFIESFPDIESLATASEQNILKVWQGLGYYSRARNLHKAAQHIYYNMSGKFPSTRNDLLKLSGIGPYTAAAISSIAFNEPYAVVDGNVYRLLSRFFAISTPIDSTQGKKEFEKLANYLLDRDNPGTFNQAMMEMGALICTPTNPLCHQCPLASECKSFLTKTTDQFPVKSKKTEKKIRHFNYAIIQTHKSLILTRRDQGDIWHGLFEPLLIESDKEINDMKFAKLIQQHWPHFNQNITLQTTKKQILTHQIIYAKIFRIVIPEETTIPDMFNSKQLLMVDFDQLKQYPIPRLIDQYFNIDFHP